MASTDTHKRKVYGAPGKPSLEIADYAGWRSLLNPLWCYHGFRMAVVGLTCLGLIMMFSSSTVTMAALGKSPLLQLLDQGAFCLIGLVLGFVALMMLVTFWKRTGVLFAAGACLLQALIFTSLGHDVHGNRGWLDLSFTTIQPTEFTKFAMCIWLPLSLHACNKIYHREGIKAYAAPSALYAIGVALVMGGRDLGMAMILVFIRSVTFLIVGFPGKWMGVGVLGVVVMVGALAVSGPDCLRRTLVTYGDCSVVDVQSVCYQPIHAKYAIASGGFLGLGIGNSREEWNYLSAAHDDFIFAIIDGETGSVGCAIVLPFFAILAWCMTVIILQVTDRYVAMVLMCVATWIVGQAMVNIDVVVGVFPVLGVPIPLVSAGDSSMVMCLTVAGLAVGLMRLQLQTKQSRQSA